MDHGGFLSIASGSANVFHVIEALWRLRGIAPFGRFLVACSCVRPTGRHGWSEVGDSTVGRPIIRSHGDELGNSTKHEREGTMPAPLEYLDQR
jgi:hypothetical protein